MRAVVRRARQPEQARAQRASKGEEFRVPAVPGGLPVPQRAVRAHTDEALGRPPLRVRDLQKRIQEEEPLRPPRRRSPPKLISARYIHIYMYRSHLSLRHFIYYQVTQVT